MSAPANMGYEYGYPGNNNMNNNSNAPVNNGVAVENGSNNGSIPGSNSNTARSFEDDYTVQMK